MSETNEKRLVLVNMSDRPDSNSGRVLIYLQQVLEETAQGTRLIFDRMNLLDEMHPSSCRGCAECYRDVDAHQDEFPGVYERIEQSDFLIAASPTRYGNTSPLGNILINRSDPYFGRNGESGFAKKNAMGIVTAGSTEDRARHTLGCLEHWFHGHSMNVIEGAMVVGMSQFVDDRMPENLPQDIRNKIEGCAARIAALF